MSLGTYRLVKKQTRQGTPVFVVEIKENGKWKSVYSHALRAFCLTHLSGKSFTDHTKAEATADGNVGAE
jgi:arylamine N-acetyltransferase